MRPAEEPCRVEEERERCLGLGVVLEEVLGEDLLDGLSVFVVETAVSHGAGASADIFQHGHRDLPHVGVGQNRARLDGAREGELVLQGVGPRWGGGRHG